MQMPTNAVTGRVETRSISIAAPPEAVLAVVGDPYRLPDWAPGFAPPSSRDGDDWLIGTRRRAVRDQRPRVGRARDRRSPAVPTTRRSAPGCASCTTTTGSELVFTLVFPAGVDHEVIRAQMETVEAELETVRTLVEAPTG